MSKTIAHSPQKKATRCIKIDRWIFEIKTVRAIRVDEYGQPYSGIANININGDKAYIDGLMTNSDCDFDREDFAAFKAYLQQLDITKAEFDRYKNQEAISKSLDVPPLKGRKIALKLATAC
ncbi:hypothetical protein [Colwellia piezophila]|uniref:hypothetical protein n=1 Tax=Colwellia piezophila TaxID=211668 RepID=UPI00037D8188|nr:hypothetical protein [Colwellia piezophila]